MTSIFGFQNETLSTAGGTMNGILSMGGNPITDVLETIYDTNPLPNTPGPNGLTLYTSGNQLKYKDQTGAVYVVGTAVVGGYLPLAGGTMSGSIDMGAQEITNASALRFNDTNVTIGSSSTIGVGTLDNVNIGNATTVGFGAAQNVLIGLQASLNTTTAGNVVVGTLAASTLGGNSVIVGQQSQARGNAVAVGKEAVAGASSVVVGYRSSSGINTDSIVLGHDNTSSGTSADILGVNRTNNQANTLLLGNGAYTNIRANNTCDLGTAAIPFQTLYLNNSISGPSNSRAVDDIVSNAGTATSGRVATFSSNKVIQDGGTLLSDLATNTGVSTTYLAKAGGTMSGSINMGAQTITNVASISTSAADINIGNTNTIGTGGWVTVGAGNTAGGSGGGLSVIYGASNNTSGSTNGQSIIYGNGNSDSNAAGGTFMFGFSNTNGTGQRNIFIGRNNTVPSGINSAIAIGFAQTNSIDNSLLLGITANIRASATTCDLGTSTVPFQNLFLNGRVDSAAGLNLGTTNATGVTIAKSTIPTIISGKGYVATTRPIMSGGYCMVTDTTVQNTVTETNIIGAGVGTLTAPANTATVGNSSRMQASGSVTITGTPSITLRLYGGPASATLLATYPINLATLTGAPPPWNLQTVFTTKTIGVAGTIQINSIFSVNDASPSQVYVNQTLATLDTTVANIVRMSVQWSSANASNVFITNQFITHSIYTV